jgi:hypothetical protein
LVIDFHRSACDLDRFLTEIDAELIEISSPAFRNDRKSMPIAYAAIEIACKSIESEEKSQELLQFSTFLTRFSLACGFYSEELRIPAPDNPKKGGETHGQRKQQQ